MAKNIIVVDLFKDPDSGFKIQDHLLVEKSGSKYIVSASQTDLYQALKSAKEIYLNISSIAQAVFSEDLIKKNSRRNLKIAAGENARRKRIEADDMIAEISVTGEETREDQKMSRVAYAAIPASDITDILSLDELKKIGDRIKYLTILPIALASAVNFSAKSRGKSVGGFMTVWVSEDLTILSISSSRGLVKIGRQLNFGLSKNYSSVPAADMEKFFDDLTNEIIATLKKFYREHRYDSVEQLYIFGSSVLETNFDGDKLAQYYSYIGKKKIEIIFGLAGLPVEYHPFKYNSSHQISERMNLISPLFLSERTTLIDHLFFRADHFNFLPQKMIKQRVLNIGLSILLELVWGGVLIILLLSFLKPAGDFEKKSGELKNLQNSVQDYKKKINEFSKELKSLKTYSGWKNFYEITCKNGPLFNSFLSELGLLIRPEMVIDKIHILPAEIQGKRIWNCQMTLRIKSRGWKKGLRIIRDFGKDLQSSPFFKIRQVNYKTETSLHMNSQDDEFICQIFMQLLPGNLENRWPNPDGKSKSHS